MCKYFATGGYNNKGKYDALKRFRSTSMRWCFRSKLFAPAKVYDLGLFSDSEKYQVNRSKMLLVSLFMLTDKQTRQHHNMGLCYCFARNNMSTSPLQ